MAPGPSFVASQTHLEPDLPPQPRPHFWVVVLCVWAIALGIAAHAGAQRDPGEVAQQVHAEGGYASDVHFTGPGGAGEFPGSGGGAFGEENERLAPGSNADDLRRLERGAHDPQAGQPRDAGWTLPGFGVAGGLISKILLIATVGALLVLVIALVVSMWPKGGVPAAPRRPVATAAPAESELPWDVGDPDALAAEGRFADAIVALLVRSLKLAGWREDRRSATAREIFFGLDGADPRRHPLGQVVAIAERVRFAGETADRAAFDQARAGYQNLTATS